MLAKMEVLGRLFNDISEPGSRQLSEQDIGVWKSIKSTYFYS